jgi:hypothetical protein
LLAEVSDVLRLLARALPALAISGCSSVGPYATPRTLGPGDVAGGAALELRPLPSNSGLAVAPSVVGEARVGVVERLDVGVRSEDGDSFGLNAKVWVVKSPFFDLAFAAGFNAYLIPGLFDSGTSSAARIYGGPVVGLNLSRQVSLTAWYAMTRLDWTGQRNGELDGAGEWTGQGGLGADFRVTRRFAIHPAVTLIDWGTPTSTDPQWTVVYGVGFIAGRLPSFADVR